MTAADVVRTPIRVDSIAPLWSQAADAVRARILDGALKPGMRLPPERELCLSLDISRVTLRKALLRLVEEGVLKSSHGRGWYVAGDDRKEWPNSLESFSETAQRMGLVASSVVLRCEPAMATLDEAERLGVAPGTSVFQLARVRNLDGVPIAIDRSIVPAHLAPSLGQVDFTTASLYDTLADAGLDLIDAGSTIEAREADEEVAGLLGVAPNRPVLVMHQIVRDRGGRAILSSTIQYAGDRYRLRTFFARAGSGPGALTTFGVD
ncbi:GntR family transcriptional regulator [Plantibacter sp. YIM 135249]|jgi:GntR family transcriptional regulator|uniref:GntR family transcriptional regulator n=1 Tax=Plantibacter sp. YIM 135249 TaxID=3423918 RepID=UPI003D331C05